LTVAVGEPPRRPFEENDAGYMFCIVDVAILCLIIAACLLAVGFATMPRECEVGEGPASGALVSEDEQEENTRPIIGKETRMFIAVVFSALSGGVLNVKSSVLSALLCGL